MDVTKLGYQECNARAAVSGILLVDADHEVDEFSTGALWTRPAFSLIGKQLRVLAFDQSPMKLEESRMGNDHGKSRESPCRNKPSRYREYDSIESTQGRRTKLLSPSHLKL